MPEERLTQNEENQAVFSEQQVAEIIQRAAQIQMQQPLAYTPGITREELLRIAKELGVSPEALQQAVHEHINQPNSQPPGFNPTFERVVEGELDPSDFDIITDEISVRSRRGQEMIRQVGRSLTSSVTSGIGSANLEVNARGGRTKISVKSQPVITGLVSLYPAAVIAGIVGPNIAQSAAGTPAGLAAAIAILAAGTGLFFGLHKHNVRKARELADRLSDAIRKHLDSPK